MDGPRQSRVAQRGAAIFGSIARRARAIGYRLILRRWIWNQILN